MRALALLVVGVLGGCVQSPSPSPDLSPHADQGPVYHADIQSFTCKPSHGGTRASVTVQNSGGNAIPFAKAFFRVGTENVDTYFSPTTIPAQAFASADRMVKTSGACQLIAIQDGDGNAVQIHEIPATSK